MKLTELPKSGNAKAPLSTPANDSSVLNTGVAASTDLAKILSKVMIFNFFFICWIFQEDHDEDDDDEDDDQEWSEVIRNDPD